MSLFELKTTGHSSSRYGVCEVCGTHASEVFTLMQSRRSIFPHPVTGQTFLIGGNSIFGHKECLKKIAEEASR